MLISYDKRFIFFHVAKVAGISIRQALAPYCREPTHFKIARPPEQLPDSSPNPLYQAWSNTLLHAKARDARRELPALFSQSYKFAFVRNPWDWHVSMYHFLLAQNTHVHHQKVKEMNNFDDFIDWVVATPNPFTRGATKQQSEILTDDAGHLLVDFVGRFETLAQDFALVCQQIGVDVDLPRLNTTTHGDYREYYTERSRALIAESCRVDIDRFGYRFED